MTYFKLNNHSAYQQGCVADYLVPAQLVGEAGGFEPVAPGRRLDLVVKQNARNSLENVPVGAQIVIFQNICNRSQVVTHLLRVTGPGTFAHGLGGGFAGWPYARTTVVERMLAPAAFGGQPDVFHAGNGAMMAQFQPQAAPRLQDLLGGFVTVYNGLVYDIFGGRTVQPGAVDKHLVPANGYLLAPPAQ